MAKCCGEGKDGQQLKYLTKTEIKKAPQYCGAFLIYRFLTMFGMTTLSCIGRHGASFARAMPTILYRIDTVIPNTMRNPEEFVNSFKKSKQKNCEQSIMLIEL